MRRGNNKAMNHLIMIASCLSVASFARVQNAADDASGDNMLKVPASTADSMKGAFKSWVPRDLPVEAERVFYGVLIERLEGAVAAAAAKEVKKALKLALKAALVEHARVCGASAWVNPGRIFTGAPSKGGSLGETQETIKALRGRLARVEDQREAFLPLITAIGNVGGDVARALKAQSEVSGVRAAPRAPKAVSAEESTG
jgi:hypothetical protein